jgi:hypothetical protein
VKEKDADRSGRRFSETSGDMQSDGAPEITVTRVTSVTQFFFASCSTDNIPQDTNKLPTYPPGRRATINATVRIGSNSTRMVKNVSA